LADDALRFLNDAMLRQDLEARFITVAFMLLTVGDETARLSVACGGHPAPILVPATGGPAAIEAQGTLLGVWPDVDISAVEVQLTPGDTIIAYTDGVTDQGPAFRFPSPSKMFSASTPGSTADQLAGVLDRYARELTGAQRDDIAILALRFTGRPGSQPGSVAVASRPSRAGASARAGFGTRSPASTHTTRNPVAIT
jgi:serine phosphatase RsbU (regulator of sigma subunit)